MNFHLRVRYFIVILCIAGFVIPVQSQNKPAYSLNDTLSPSPSVVIGTLPNGLKYYIRENKKPEDRMELRLVVKAGSVLEDDDQQGLAHFDEHMAFNGTKSFPKQDLVNFLERTGVRFGPHLNAYTSFDETVYMLQVPTDSPAVMQKSFTILKEWAHDVTYDSVEIDKERGVVGEEWRLGLGAYERIRNKQYPVIFYKSKYAKRLPIGKKEIIDTAHDSELKRFYHDWYRPDLMAVIAVGDFDKTKIESMIKEHFAGLHNPPHERPRPEYTLPDHKEELVSIATDKELPVASVTIYFKRDVDPQVSVKDYRRYILDNLYDGMFNARLNELLQKPNPPFIYASGGNFTFVGKKQAYGLSAGLKQDNILNGIEALVSEAYRVKDFGFTQTELDRQKASLLRSMEEAYRERDKTESGTHASEYIRNFLDNELIPGISAEYALYKQYLPTITLDEVNALSDVRMTDNNRVMTVSVPDKDGITVPTKKEVIDAFREASEKKLEPYVDAVTNKPLLAEKPAPGKVTSEEEIKDLSAWKWTLSNGAHVILKPTDFKNDQILFGAYSPGGNSLAPDSNYLSSNVAASFTMAGGVGQFDAITLQKMLAGKVVRVSPYIGELSEGFSGSSSPQDLETLFQLVYLDFTSPRYDTSAINAQLSRIRSYYQNISANPDVAFRDTIQVTLSQYNFRERPITPALLDEIHPATAYAFYKNRFADADDFTFFIVGNFTLDGVKPLVEEYLASLPTMHREESWNDVGIRRPDGVISKTVYKGIEPKSTVRISFGGPFEWNVQNRFDFNAMIEVMKIKLREVMREDKSGVYGVSISGAPSLSPRQEYSISVGFGCKPERVDELVQTLYQQIDSVQQQPVDQVYINKVKELLRRDREVNLKENSWWLSLFRSTTADNEDPRIILTTNDRIDHLTANAVQAAAKKYFDMKNVAKFVLMPEQQTTEDTEKKE